MHLHEINSLTRLLQSTDSNVITPENIDEDDQILPTGKWNSKMTRKQVQDMKVTFIKKSL